MRAAGPTEGNRKHHPKVAPPESYTAFWRFGFSRPQKMVFDCVYGRRKAVATNGNIHVPLAERQQVTIPHLLGSAMCDLHPCASGTQPASSRDNGPFPMPTSVLWHGSQTEALELLQALSRNCSCVVTAEGVRLSTCAPHQMLSTDQRAIDGLLFARRIAARLRSEEFSAHLAQSVT